MTHSNRLVEPRCVFKEADSRGERAHALGLALGVQY